MENLTSLLTVIGTAIGGIVAVIFGIYQKIKATIHKTQNDDLQSVVQKLDIKDAVTKFVIEAEQIFMHGDNIAKLTWVIDKVQNVLGYENGYTSIIITDEVNKVLQTIKGFNKSTSVEKE